MKKNLNRVRIITFRVTEDEYAGIANVALAADDEPNSWCRSVALNSINKAQAPIDKQAIYTEIACLRHLSIMASIPYSATIATRLRHPPGTSLSSLPMTAPTAVPEGPATTTSGLLPLSNFATVPTGHCRSVRQCQQRTGSRRRLPLSR